MVTQEAVGCGQQNSKQQEPRILAAVTQDPALLDAYENDKDMYAVLGTRVFHNNYEDNLEHFPDGTKNEEGTARRKKMKVLYLGGRKLCPLWQ